jgi:hypothetical protein
MEIKCKLRAKVEKIRLTGLQRCQNMGKRLENMPFL